MNKWGEVEQVCEGGVWSQGILGDRVLGACKPVFFLMATANFINHKHHYWFCKEMQINTFKSNHSLNNIWAFSVFTGSGCFQAADTVRQKWRFKNHPAWEIPNRSVDGYVRSLIQFFTAGQYTSNLLNIVIFRHTVPVNKCEVWTSKCVHTLFLYLCYPYMVIALYKHRRAHSLFSYFKLSFKI